MQRLTLSVRAKQNMNMDDLFPVQTGESCGRKLPSESMKKDGLRLALLPYFTGARIYSSVIRRLSRDRCIQEIITGTQEK